MKTAWVFPGQGSQAIAMDVDLASTDLGKARLVEAEAILGWSISEMCNGELEQLSETQYTQPCLYVVGCILADLMLAQGQLPAMVAGHSLGEYVALYTAGVFSFEAGLKLVQKRSQLMAQASDGMMAALMGFDRAQLDAELAKQPGAVLANDNNPGQAVISGEPEAVQAVMAAVKSKKAVPLKVSGAFHSPLMAGASSQYQAVLEGVEFEEAKVPVLSNVEPEPSTDAVTLKARLAQQMTGSVRWQETSLKFAELGLEQVIEVGPGKVLTGLIKRTCKDLKLMNIDSAAAVAAQVA
jgi:[acyl-carrier-protein] S-malonyltransferase